MSFLVEVLVFLCAAIVVVPICKRLGLSAVLGYLGAGLLIGPPGLGIISDAAETLKFAELGIVLLLFVIGLELHPKRLWVMRHLVFGLGLAQVLLSTAVIGGILLLLGLPLAAATLLGFSLALSSTAFVLQLLGEHKKLSTHHGRAAFGTLLLQDLAVIPAIAALNLLDTAKAGSGLDPALIALVVAGAVAARFLLRPLLRVIAATDIHELFTAAALALVAGAALAMDSAGLSMGLGAFIAGVIVADSEYRHQLEADVTPFKGLLLGLFFIAVGMYVDLDLLTENPLLIISMTVALMTIKALVLWPLGLWQGLSRRETLKTSLVLAQGGEFAFVLLAAGLGAGLVESQIANTAVLVVTLSMAFTPLLVFLGDRILGDSSAAREFDVINPSDDNAVVIAGFGTVGQIVGRILSTQHIRFTALDVNPQHVDFIRKLGNDTYYGDATRLDVLRAAGVGKARMLVVAIDQEEASEQIVRKVKGVYPAVNVLARAHTRQHELKLKEAGANFVIRDTLLSSLAMATELLLGLGISRADAEQAIERFRDHDAHTLEQQAAVFRDDDAFRQSALSAAEELQQLFDADAAADTERDQSTHDAREPPPAG